MCVCVSGGNKCLFFGNFCVLCFLETPVLRFALCLIPDELDIPKCIVYSQLLQRSNICIFLLLFELLVGGVEL